MKKFSIVLAILLCFVTLFPAHGEMSSLLRTVCAHSDDYYNPVIDYSSEVCTPINDTLHATSYKQYMECSKCHARYTGYTHVEGPNLPHIFNEYTSYASSGTYLNSSSHQVQARSYKRCSDCRHEVTLSEGLTSAPHDGSGAITSETCGSGLHRFYKYCYVCNSTYLYFSRNCDGVTHPVIMGGIVIFPPETE